MTHNLRITQNDSDWNPKYYTMITGLFCGLYVTTTAINTKLFTFFGFILPAGIITFPLCCIITDLLAEVYGFNRTRQAVWTVLACTILFALFAQAAIALPPAGFWPHQDSYTALYGTTMRLAIAGCLAWIAGELSNSYIMSKMKIFQNAKHMPLRFIGSTIVGQFFDTLVFATVAFAGTMPWADFFVLITSAWIFKIVYEIIALPLSVPVTHWVKRLEGVEHFDKQELSFV